jgi:hypothetical protein
VGVVPADRAFYDAGMAAKAAGQLGNAFVFLNRYLDLREAMEVREQIVVPSLPHPFWARGFMRA